MAFEQILSVSGKSGLFRLVGHMKNGIIVEALSDGKRFPIHGSSKVSALEEISIYTEEEEVPLKEVFTKIFEKEEGKQAISHKSDKAEIKAYFASILPDYDEDRVYVSDMVKVVQWYNVLIENNAFDPNEVEETEEGEGAEKAEAVKKEKKAAPKKTTAPKSAAKASSKAAGGQKKSANVKRGS